MLYLGVYTEGGRYFGGVLSGFLMVAQPAYES